ncbi:glucosaminyl-phosphatidylinositol-acyltransferase PIGW isoform X1 [Lampetra fluviatilis]
MEPPDTSYKELKEAFVSNLNGTDVSEIALLLTILPAGDLCRGLLGLFWAGSASAGVAFVRDFLLLVLPYTLSTTVLAPHISTVLVVLLAAAVTLTGLLLLLQRSLKCRRKAETASATADAENVNDKAGQHLFLSEEGHVRCLTQFRAYTNLLTVVCILAVDFRAFPRRFAKTEMHGTGLMDLGVGTFVLSNALVSPEARNVLSDKRGARSVTKQLLAVWPLLLLGLVRLASIKGMDYQEHVTEYGLHWNFFFTLALVRVMSVLVSACGVRRYWVAAVLLAVSYELALHNLGLKSLVLLGWDGTGGRDDLLSANREGIASVCGYLALYVAGVHVGSYLHRVSHSCLGLRDCVLVVLTMLSGVTMLWVALLLCRSGVDNVSRRLANLAFVLWTLAQSILFISTAMLFDLLLVGVTRLVGGGHAASVPQVDDGMPVHKGRQRVAPCWADSRELARRAGRSDVAGAETAGGASGKVAGGADGGGKSSTRPPPKHCLLAAINRNQLFFFLICNLCTGLVNVCTDTLAASDSKATATMTLYLLTVTLITFVLHLRQVTLKCW